MAINFYEDLSVYNHVVVEGGFFAGMPADTNYDLKIKGASLLQSTLDVSGIVTLSSVANAAADPDKFLCINGSNQVEYRTGAQVLSDIGAASSSSLSNYLPLAGGTMTGAIDMDNNNLVDVGDFNIPSTLTIQAGGDITVAGSTTFQQTTDFEANSSWTDNSKIRLGNSNDLEIYHDGSDSIIKDGGTGSLDILSSHVHLKSSGGTSNLAQFFSGGHSYIYANNVLRIEATTTGATITGGLEVGGASSRFTDSVRFTSNATFDDNSEAIFGDDSDLKIYHNGSNSIIEDAGTGDLVVKFSNDLLIQGQNGDKSINCNEGNSVQLYYDNSEKLETKSNGIEVTGDVLDRDIPCVLVSNFSDDSSTTSYIYMPFNSTSDGTSNNYYHYFAAPAAGKVVSIMMMHVFGTMTSSFTTQIRIYKNGVATSTSSELTPSNGTNDGSYVEYTPGTVFAKGDRLQFAYQKSSTSKYWRGVAATMVIELTDYDI